VLGYSAVINKDYKNSECQAFVTCVYERNDKLELCCRSLHINVQPDHLQFCDFTKHGNSKVANKKTNQTLVVGDIVSSHRANILSRIPFFQPRAARASSPALVVAEEQKVDITGKFSKVLCTTEVNHRLEDSNSFYLLAVSKEQKLVVQKYSVASEETGLKLTQFKPVEVEPYDSSLEYTISHEGDKVIIVRGGAVCCLNAKKLTDQIVISLTAKPIYAVLKHAIDQAEFAGSDEQNEKEVTEALKDNDQPKTK